MAKFGLISVALAVAMTVSPVAAQADGSMPSNPPPPYQGPLPAGGAMTHEAAVAWYDSGPLLPLAGGALVAGVLLLLLSHHGHSSTATTTTTTTQ